MRRWFRGIWWDNSGGIYEVKCSLIAGFRLFASVIVFIRVFGWGFEVFLSARFLSGIMTHSRPYMFARKDNQNGKITNSSNFPLFIPRYVQKLCPFLLRNILPFSSRPKMVSFPKCYQPFSTQTFFGESVAIWFMGSWELAGERRMGRVYPTRKLSEQCVWGEEGACSGRERVTWVQLTPSSRFFLSFVPNLRYASLSQFGPRNWTDARRGREKRNKKRTWLSREILPTPSRLSSQFYLFWDKKNLAAKSRTVRTGKPNAATFFEHPRSGMRLP